MNPTTIKHFGFAWFSVIVVWIIMVSLFPEMILSEIAYHSLSIIFVTGIGLTMIGVGLERMKQKTGNWKL